jgi:hypothetical protein
MCDDHRSAQLRHILNAHFDDSHGHEKLGWRAANLEIWQREFRQ